MSDATTVISDEMLQRLQALVDQSAGNAPSESPSEGTAASNISQAAALLRLLPIGQLDDLLHGNSTHQRSRTGCLSCRRRKKKCPERYIGNDCIRCRRAGIVCVRPTPEVNAQGSGGSQNAESSRKRQRRQASPVTQPEESRPETPPPAVDLTSLLASPPTAAEATCSQRPHPGPLAASSTDDAIVPDDSSLHEGLTEFMMMDSLLQDLAAPPSDGNMASAEPGLAETSSRLAQHSSGLAEQSPCPTAPLLASPQPSTIWPAVEDEALLADFYVDVIVRAWSASSSEEGYSDMISHCRNEVAKSHVLRASRNAVSIAYIERLKTWHGSRGRSMFRQSALPRRYHSLSLDSKALFDTAVSLLQTAPTADLRSPLLEAHLWSVVNLMTAALANHGGQAVQVVHNLREELVTRAFGDNPPVNLTSLGGIASFALRCFAMDDLNRSIAERRPTKFVFLDPRVTQAPEMNHFGLPSTLAWLIACASNVCAAVKPYVVVGSVPPGLFTQAQSIRSQLAAWSPRAVDQHQQKSSSGSSDSHFPELAVQQDLWRRVGLLLIDRIVLQQEIQNLAFRQSLAQAVALLKCVSILCEERIKRRNTIIDLWAAYYAAPAFVIGCCSLDQDDRQFCQDFIAELGPDSFLRELETMLQTVWMTSDLMGYWPDWLDLADQAVLSVSFM